jgi:PTS system fructose-specific IIA component
VISRTSVEHLRSSIFLKGLKATTEISAIEKMLGALKGHPSVIDLAALTSAIFERQKEDPPIFPGGIAFPHGRTNSVRSLVLVTATCPEPIPFRGAPIRLIFLIGVPKLAITDYLEMTSFLARHVQGVELVDRLVQANDLSSFLGEFPGAA